MESSAMIHAVEHGDPEIDDDTEVIDILKKIDITYVFNVVFTNKGMKISTEVTLSSPETTMKYLFIQGESFNHTFEVNKNDLISNQNTFGVWLEDVFTEFFGENIAKN